MIDRFGGEYRFLSNFYEHPVLLDGVAYPTVEHAYQAAKTEDRDEQKFVALAQTPGIAKRRGRNVTLRPNWEKMKLGVMEVLLRRKFYPNGERTELGRRLTFTSTELLIEGNTWGDKEWGCVQEGQHPNGTPRWVGKNHLGTLLMKIRGEMLLADMAAVEHELSD